MRIVVAAGVCFSLVLLNPSCAVNAIDAATEALADAGNAHAQAGPRSCDKQQFDVLWRGKLASGTTQEIDTSGHLSLVATAVNPPATSCNGSTTLWFKVADLWGRSADVVNYAIPLPVAGPAARLVNYSDCAPEVAVVGIRCAQ
jgi:hypothetical protein